MGVAVSIASVSKQKVDQVAQRAAQPIELLDNESVPYRERLETAGQFRSFDMRPRSFLNKDTSASDLLQGGQL